MMGGMICPPVEAAASTAPANCGRYPIRRIKGMVKVPVAKTLAAAAPLIVRRAPGQPGGDIDEILAQAKSIDEGPEDDE